MREGVTYKRLGDLVKIRTGKLDANAADENGQYPFFTCSREPLRINKYSYDCECVLVAGNGDLNVKYHNGKFDAYQRTYIIEKKDDVAEISVPYLYRFFELYVEELRQGSIGGIIKYIKLGNLTEAQIPVPSLSGQELIVRELDSISSVISAKKQQVLELDNLAQAIFLDMFGDPITNPKGWEVKRWEDAVTIINGRNQAAVECEDGQYPICGSGGEMGRANEYLSPEFSIIIGRKGNINKPILMREKFWNIDTAFGIVPITDIVNADYLYHFCLHFDFELLNVTVTIPSLRKADLLKIRIPLPPLSLQQAFAEKVQAIEEQKRLINQSIAEFESLLAQRMEFHFA